MKTLLLVTSLALLAFVPAAYAQKDITCAINPSAPQCQDGAPASLSTSSSTSQVEPMQPPTSDPVPVIVGNPHLNDSDMRPVSDTVLPPPDSEPETVLPPPDSDPVELEPDSDPVNSDPVVSDPVMPEPDSDVIETGFIDDSGMGPVIETGFIDDSGMGPAIETGSDNSGTKP